MICHCATPRKSLRIRQNLKSKMVLRRSSNVPPTEPPIKPPKWNLISSIKGAINKVSKSEIKIPIPVNTLKVELPKLSDLSDALSPLKDIPNQLKNVPNQLKNVPNQLKNVPNQLIDTTKMGLAQSQNLINEVKAQARRQIRNKIIKVLVICMAAYLVVMLLYMGFLYVGTEYPKWLGK